MASVSRQELDKIERMEESVGHKGEEEGEDQGQGQVMAAQRRRSSAFLDQNRNFATRKKGRVRI